MLQTIQKINFTISNVDTNDKEALKSILEMANRTLHNIESLNKSYSYGTDLEKLEHEVNVLKENISKLEDKLATLDYSRNNSISLDLDSVLLVKFTADARMFLRNTKYNDYVPNEDGFYTIELKELFDLYYLMAKEMPGIDIDDLIDKEISIPQSFLNLNNEFGTRK